jgi:hypothetical protein
MTGRSIGMRPRGRFSVPLSVVVCAMIALALTQSEKASRTPAQQKIDSRLLYEIYRLRGEAEQKGVPPGDTGVRIDDRKRALVDVRAGLTPALRKTLTAADARIVSTSTASRSIVAWIPLLSLERIAEDSAVRGIQPAPAAILQR